MIHLRNLLSSSIKRHFYLNPFSHIPKTRHLTFTSNPFFCTSNNNNSGQKQQQLKQEGKQFYSNFVEDIIELKVQEDFNSILSSTAEPIYVYFYATWSAPCKKITEKLQHMVKNGKIKTKLLKIQIDKFGKIAHQLKIKSVPVVLLVYNTRQFAGLQDQQLTLESLEKLQDVVQKITKTDIAEGTFIEQMKTIQQLLQNKNYKQAQPLLLAINCDDVQPEFGYVKDIYLSLVYAQLEKISQLNAHLEKIKINKQFYINGQLKQFYEYLFMRAAQIQENLKSNTEMVNYEQQIKKEPENLDLLYNYAVHLKETNLHDQALDKLFTILKKNKNWQDKKANNLILSIFKQLGNASPITQKNRKIYQRILA